MLQTDVQSDVLIRPALPTDAEAIARLVTELGSPSSTSQLVSRFAALQREPAALAVVAETDGAAMGLATAHTLRAIHIDVPVVYLTALVVLTAARRRGVGRALVAHIEAWAKAQGATRLALVAGLQRPQAHLFYEQLGYVRTGHRFAKPL